MESYMEFSMIHQILLNYISLYLSKLWIQRMISYKKMLLYSILSTLLPCMLWNPILCSIVICIDIGCGLLFFSNHKRILIVGYGIRIAYMLTCFLLFEGSFHHFMWFIPIDFPCIYLYIIQVICICILHSAYRYKCIRSGYIYDICILDDHYNLHMKGYLDSGNICAYKGIPVVFLDEKYESYFHTNDIQYIEIHTMNQRSTINVVKKRIQFEDGYTIQVWIGFSSLVLHDGCEMLLNMKVLI